MANDEIMLTSDVLNRYKISRSTLYFWSTPSRMPASFKRPFPQPTIGGSPKRWRTSDVLRWEEDVNAAPMDAPQFSPDDRSKSSASDADRPDSRADCTGP